MEQREELQNDQAGQLQKIDELADQLSAARAARDEALVTIDASRHQLASRRSEVTASSTPICSRSTNANVPTAVPEPALLQGRRCGACRIEIDRGEMQRIAAAPADDVLRCPECGAILLRLEGVRPSEGEGRGRRRLAGQSGARRIRRGGVLGRPRIGPGGAQGVDRQGHQQRRRVPRPHRGAGGRRRGGRHRGGRLDGLQTGGRADGRPMARQASRSGSAQPTGQASWRRGFDRVTYAWIPRAENSHADKLANEAMDAAADPSRGIGACRDDQACRHRVLARGLDRGTRRSDPVAVAAPRPDRTVGPAPLLGPGQPAAHRARSAPGRRRRASTWQSAGGIAAVVSSPLQRAYDTATAAAEVLGLDVTVDDDLIETDFGAWEGLTFGEAAARDPELHTRWLSDTAPAAARRRELRRRGAPGASRAQPDHRRPRRCDRAGGRRT